MKYGAAHVRGLYNWPDDGNQFANGCNEIWDLGLRTLKIYCTGAYLTDYPLQTSWSSTPTTCTELCQTTQFTTQLAKAWDTVIMTVFTFANNPGTVTNWWRAECTNAKLLAEYTEIYNLTVHLLTTYNNTGKCIVLQNWEGDHAFLDSVNYDDFVDRKYVDYYAAFLQYRQRAVEDARKATAHYNVTVLHAIEANRVLDVKDRPGSRRILSDIASRVTPDVVSWSAYDGTISVSGWTASQALWETTNAAYFAEGIALIRKAWPGCRISIGEVGLPENEAPVGFDISEMIEIIRDWAVAAGVEWFIYWEVFDNEAGTPPDDYRGYYLIKDDGTQSLAGAKFADFADGR